MDFYLPPINEGLCDFSDSESMNLKPRITTDKETIYAWYPPQWNRNSKPRYKELDGYAKEFLYRHCQKSTSPQAAKTPSPPPGTKRSPSPCRPKSGITVRRSSPTFIRSSSNQATNSGTALKRQIKKQEELRRQKQQELRVDTRCESVASAQSENFLMDRSRMLQSSWQFNKPNTDYVVTPMEGPDRIPRPCLKNYGIRYSPDISVSSDCPISETGRPQSAIMRTPEKSIPKRPVKSAGVRRPEFPVVPSVEKIVEELRASSQTPSSVPMTPDSSVCSPPPSEHTTSTLESEQTSRSSRASRVKSAPPTVRSVASRPDTPTPDLETDVRPLTANAVVDKPDSELTYDELVNKYGWKAQIHGDPLHLKKNVIKERLPYYVTCPVPEVPKEPPKMHHEVWDTFFLNTIPRKPMTFTIAPDWVSEVFHAKRMELQKREGLNYRYKDFAFVY